ncbi:MAG: flagellar motor protein MotA [Capsulimonas sp.]|nr:flagellar motor protein MotA [Capsulimonas sp.]
MLNNGLAFLLKGGPVMWPLFLCAIASVTVMIERYFALRSVLRGSRGLRLQVRSSLAQGRERAALDLLDVRSGPIARVLRTALEFRALGRQNMEHLVTEVAMDETPSLSRGLNILDTVITIAPLLGLLGTVTGMIAAFQVVAVSTGLSAPTEITGGVAEALIATATGLAIAITTLVGYNYLTEQVRRIVAEMEMAATQLINDLELRNLSEEHVHETAGV